MNQRTHKSLHFYENKKTGQNFELTLEIDIDELAGQMAFGAVMNIEKRSTAMKGAIVGKITKIEPAK